MKLSYIGILGFLAAARCEGTITPSEVYNSPTHHGKLVDWCLHFDPQDCGQKAADLYCVLEQTYESPVMHEYALDDCYEFKKQCQSEAADAFCQENGYVKAIDYAKVPAEELTMTIGDHAICNPEW
eukprot:821990_1